MKKVFAVLLLISAVIGMAVPVMATPSSSVSSNVDVDVAGTNWAANEIAQIQEFNGDQSNAAVIAAVGGDADARSNADADGNAQNSGAAEVESDDDSLNAALAGNLLSGNGLAISGAEANAGNGHNNGDIVQSNAVVQIATADITNLQVMKQKVIVPVDINTTVTEIDTDVSSVIEESIVGNDIDDSELEIEEE